MSRHFNLPRPLFFGVPVQGWAVLLALFFALPIVRAQDAIRPSLAGEASAESRRQSLDHIPYNLLMGPVRFRFSATAGLEYNDNVNVAEVNEQDDFIFRPQVNLNALWPVTQLNTLRLDIGVGYAFYLDHSEYNTNALLLSPNSQLAFDVFVGDFRINFHDRFSLEQDPIGEPGLSNVADYGRFQNTAGVSVLWDLNKAVVTFGYDHYTFIATNDDFDYLDRNAEMLNASISFAATSTTGIGLEGSYVFNRYDQDVLNDSNTYNIGAFVETQLTNYLRLRLAGGYQSIEFDGDTVVLGGVSMELLAVGPVVGDNLLNLGHIDIKANGQTEAKLPGDANVAKQPLPLPSPGDAFRIVRAGGPSTKDDA